MSKAVATTWRMPEHTAAKHRLLDAYLDQWFPKMSWARRLVYLDAFAGPGRYENGQEGSPLIALRALLEHQHFERWTNERRHYTFVFVEPDAARSANLSGEIKGLLVEKGRPANVDVIVRTETFQDAGNSLLADLASRGAKLAPTLALIDPFGFSTTPMNLVARLAGVQRCEVLVNFMIDFINRFATAENTPAKIGTHLERLFGCQQFADAPPAGDPQRRPYLLDLYMAQLRSEAGLTYLRSFEMVNERGRNVYDLVYGTKHPAGLEAIKTAMWKVDPEQGRRFTAGDPTELRLFRSTPQLGPLRAQLRQRFTGQEVGIKEVEDFVLHDTDYLPKSHLKRATLTPMEKAGEVEVTAGRAKSGFPDGCRLRFS